MEFKRVLFRSCVTRRSEWPLRQHQRRERGLRSIDRDALHECHSARTKQPAGFHTTRRRLSHSPRVWGPAAIELSGIFSAVLRALEFDEFFPARDGRLEPHFLSLRLYESGGQKHRCERSGRVRTEWCEMSSAAAYAKSERLDRRAAACFRIDQFSHQRRALLLSADAGRVRHRWSHDTRELSGLTC